VTLNGLFSGCNSFAKHVSYGFTHRLALAAKSKAGIVVNDLMV
jgi:hypothetical protein